MRGHGAGTSLLGKLVELFPGRDISADVVENNRKGEVFYERRGFAPRERLEAMLFGEAVIERRWWRPADTESYLKDTEAPRLERCAPGSTIRRPFSGPSHPRLPVLLVQERHQGADNGDGGFSRPASEPVGPPGDTNNMSVHIVWSRLALAVDLWRCGEPRLAAQALEMTPDDLVAIGDRAGQLFSARIHGQV